MPNIKRRFKDDDPSSDEEEEEPTYHPPRGGGKAFRMPGGKGFGKQLRPLQHHDDDSEEDSDDDEDEEPQQPVYRQGGGKQLRPPGGKMLRPPPQDDDSDDDDDDDDMEEDEPVRPVHRGGGKSLMRMRAPSEDDDDSDEDEEEAPPQRIAQRGGGKSLMRMQATRQDDSDEDESSEEEEPTRVVHRGGGKQLRPPSAGKQLRRGGKQLRPPPADDDDDDDSDEEDDVPQPVQVVRRGGGKSLMRMQVQHSDSEEDEDLPRKTSPSGKKTDKKAAENIEEAAAAPDEDDDDSDEDDMDVDSDGENQKRELPASKEKSKTEEPEVEESEDDESSDEEEAEFDNETFDPQKLVKDEEDQKYLDSLPELEREAILGERFEKRKADMDMKKALRDAKRKEREQKAAKDQKGSKKRKATTKAAVKKTTPAKKKKQAADTAEDETLAKSLASKRESTRNRDATGTKAKTAAALAVLREERKKIARKDSSDSESSFGDDDSDDSDDDYEESGNVASRPWRQKKTAEPRKSRLDQIEESEDEMEQADAKDEDDNRAAEIQRFEQDAELEDYRKITLSRRRLGRWCNEPYFKKAVVGCFAKLFIGENELGKRCYRLCRIVDVQPAPKGSYALPAVKKEKPVVTDKALQLQFGKNKRVFLIKLISDNKATETDVSLYKTEMKNQRLSVLSRNEANKIRRKQDSLVSNYTYTTEDIESNLRKRKKKGSAMANLGLEQTRAAIAVQAAKAALEEAVQQTKTGDGDSSAVDAAEKELEDRLEDERRVLERVKNRKERLTQRGTDKKWAKVNQRALEMNQKLDRGALKEPEEQKVDSGAKPKFNPYARRKVKPKILWEVGQKEEEEQEEKNETSNAADENTEKELDSTPNLVQEQQQKAAALSQSHQFAIDEETLAQSSYTSGIAGLTAKKPVRKRVRKGLSLNEYLERKEAGTL